MPPISSNATFFYKLLIGSIVAVLGLVCFNPESSSFENLALGKQTSVYQGKNDVGETIHFLKLDSTGANQFEQSVGGIYDSIVLILGNSQTHSINQLKKNDCNYVEILSRTLKEPVFAFSFPNANIQEQLLTFNYVLSRAKVKSLVLPIFMDDLREDGVRDVFFSKLLSDRKLKDGENEEPTLQDRSEAYLNSYLKQNFNLWSMRENMRGNLFNWLYMLRNTVFGIRPGTTRHMISELYKKNFIALESIFNIAVQKKIEVFLYIPPIRCDVKSPYDLDEYHEFKKDLFKVVAKYPNVSLKDYSSIVPGIYWGYKEPTNLFDEREIDFMHFQFAGHRILADSLIHFFKKTK